MSWREVLMRLEEPFNVKRVVYRHHRLVGVLIVAGALYALDWLWWDYNRGAVAGMPRGDLWPILIDCVHLFLLTGNAVALIAGLVVTFRPSLLKPLERWTDRIYGGR